MIHEVNIDCILQLVERYHQYESSVAESILQKVEPEAITYEFLFSEAFARWLLEEVAQSQQSCLEFLVHCGYTVIEDLAEDEVSLSSYLEMFDHKDEDYFGEVKKWEEVGAVPAVSFKNLAATIHQEVLTMHEDSERVDSFRMRVKHHELQHYIQGERMWGGVIADLFREVMLYPGMLRKQLVASLQEELVSRAAQAGRVLYPAPALLRAEKTLIENQKLQNAWIKAFFLREQLSCFREADAMLVEGRSTGLMLNSQTVFDADMFKMRLGILLSKYKIYQGSLTCELAESLGSIFEPTVDDMFDGYDLGVILLLVQGEILSSNPQEVFTFEALGSNPTEACELIFTLIQTYFNDGGLMAATLHARFVSPDLQQKIIEKMGEAVQEILDGFEHFVLVVAEVALELGLDVPIDPDYLSKIAHLRQRVRART